MSLKIKELEGWHLVFITMAIFVPLGIAMDHPTEAESYNQAIKYCDTIKLEVERNACRLHVTNYYKEGKTEINAVK